MVCFTIRIFNLMKFKNYFKIGLSPLHDTNMLFMAFTADSHNKTATRKLKQICEQISTGQTFRVHHLCCGNIM